VTLPGQGFYSREDAFCVLLGVVSDRGQVRGEPDDGAAEPSERGSSDQDAGLKEAVSDRLGEDASDRIDVIHGKHSDVGLRRQPGVFFVCSGNETML
jgi:hypothetical protein